jgi:ribonuclease VapC
MVLDTSALFALVAGEPDAGRFRAAILSADTLAISSVSLLETRIVLFNRFGAHSVEEFEAWLDESGVEIVPFDLPQADAAFEAFRRYGKGQGHPAQLNICDCAAYAVAKLRGDTLLFKGQDFAQTDISVV